MKYKWRFQRTASTEFLTDFLTDRDLQTSPHYKGREPDIHRGLRHPWKHNECTGRFIRTGAWSWITVSYKSFWHLADGSRRTVGGIFVVTTWGQESFSWKMERWLMQSWSPAMIELQSVTEAENTSFAKAHAGVQSLHRLFSQSRCETSCSSQDTGLLYQAQGWWSCSRLPNSKASAIQKMEL